MVTPEYPSKALKEALEVFESSGFQDENPPLLERLQKELFQPVSISLVKSLRAILFEISESRVTRFAEAGLIGGIAGFILIASHYREHAFVIGGTVSFIGAMVYMSQRQHKLDNLDFESPSLANE